MLLWAVGSPNQGDKLPDFNGVNVDINYLKERIYKQIKTTQKIIPSTKNYIENQLYFDTVDNFQYCFDIHDRQLNQVNPQVKKTTDLEWQEVYKIIEKAYRKKITFTRRNTLKVQQEKSGFDSMMKLALGNPNSGDPLAEMPLNCKNLDDIYKNITQEPVITYIQEKLYMSVADFGKIMETKKNTVNPDWTEIYRLLEKAQTKKRNFTYPPIGRTEIQNIYPNSLADVKKGETTKAQRFQTFGNITQTSRNSVGFALISPILLLPEGRRTITITFASQTKTLNRETFQKLLDSKIEPFEIYLSSGNKWIQPPTFTYQIGDFLLAAPLKSYNTSQLSLEGDRITINLTANNDRFDYSYVGQILVWHDGQILQIKEILSDQIANVQKIDTGNFSQKNNTINLYKFSDVYLNSLQFQLTLDASSPPILSPQIDELHSLNSPYPVVKILLKQISESENPSDTFIYY